jgi:hypothetical protein
MGELGSTCTGAPPFPAPSTQNLNHASPAREDAPAAKLRLSRGAPSGTSTQGWHSSHCYFAVKTRFD